jgi:SnoaL-like polyketide cyclase
MSFLERWFDEVWNKKNAKAIDDMALENAVTHGLEHPDGAKVTGREAFKDFHKQLCSTFSSIHIEVKHAITIDDLTIACCNVSAVLPKIDGREEKTIMFTACARPASKKASWLRRGTTLTCHRCTSISNKLPLKASP